MAKADREPAPAPRISYGEWKNDVFWLIGTLMLRGHQTYPLVPTVVGERRSLVFVCGVCQWRLSTPLEGARAAADKVPWCRKPGTGLIAAPMMEG